MSDGAAPHRGTPGRLTPAIRSRFQGACRVGFLVYTVALLTATHWPGVQIDGPVQRTDLWIHFIAYGGWTALLVWTGWVGAVRPRTLAIAVACGCVLGAIDEATQPWFNRTGVVDDWAADAVGSVLGAAGAWAAHAVLGRSSS